MGGFKYLIVVIKLLFHNIGSVYENLWEDVDKDPKTTILTLFLIALMVAGGVVLGLKTWSYLNRRETPTIHIPATDPKLDIWDSRKTNPSPPLGSSK